MRVIYSQIKHRLLTIGLVLLAAIAAASLPAAAQENKEYLVKSAFIVNFLKFVEWPGDKNIDKQSKVDVCLLGDNDISTTGDIYRKASTANLALSLVGESSAGNTAQHCHIVFISESESARIGEILGALKGKPVLTVSDAAGMAERGVMVGFVIDDNKVRMVVNKRAIEEAGLKVNAKLLQIALTVIDR